MEVQQMKFGYCVNMLSLPGSDGSGKEWLPMIGRLGFDYVELPMAQMMAYSDEDFERLFLKPLQESGLECHCSNNFFPASIRITGPDADHQAMQAYAEKAMARAERLGAKKIVFGSSGARNYPVAFPRAQAVAQFHQALQLLEPIAEKHGVTLVMEHLNKLESNLLNSLHEGVELVNEVQLPHVHCLLDNYHMMLAGGDVSHISEARGLLRHVHLARVLGRSLPCEGDEVDWKALFAALKEIGYDGDCSIEAYVPVENREERIAESLRFLRSAAG